MSRLRILSGWLSIFFVAVSAVPTFADQADDEAAIRNSAASYTDAFEQRDAEAVAAHWSPDAEYVTPDDGRRVKGREAISAEFARQFEQAGEAAAKLEVTIRSIRFVTADVAIEEGDARVIHQGELPADSTYVAVHVRQGDQWLLDSVRETELPAPLSNYENLRDLERLVGTWTDADDEATVETTYEWAMNRNFLVCTFKVVVGERLDMEGKQIIGWDPASGRIRSWVFDSDGGFGEGVWTKDEAGYSIDFAATLPDGGRASAVNSLSFVDENTVTWGSSGREVDGEILPSVEGVTIHRASKSE